jgi:hypothetical protein
LEARGEVTAPEGALLDALRNLSANNLPLTLRDTWVLGRRISLFVLAALLSCRPRTAPRRHLVDLLAVLRRNLFSNLADPFEVSLCDVVVVELTKISKFYLGGNVQGVTHIRFSSEKFRKEWLSLLRNAVLVLPNTWRKTQTRPVGPANRVSVKDFGNLYNIIVKLKIGSDVKDGCVV